MFLTNLMLKLALGLLYLFITVNLKGIKEPINGHIWVHILKLDPC